LYLANGRGNTMHTTTARLTDAMLGASPIASSAAAYELYTTLD